MNNLKKTITSLGFKTNKEFAQYFDLQPDYVSKYTKSGKPPPKRILNIIQAHERTKQIILNKLKD